jgi:DNA-directed RNA polymerase subunit RPC12/RpoP
MADFCASCGKPMPIGSESLFCTAHGGPALKDDDQIRCPFCRELILAQAQKCKHCGEFLQTSPAPPPPSPPAIRMTTSTGYPPLPQCRTCGLGSLLLTKAYRMSTPVAIIGYILLIPSVLGVLFCLLWGLATARVVGASGAPTGAAAVAGGFIMFFVVAFFVSGLLGWLLVMKKKVLRCSHCSAVVPAS